MSNRLNSIGARTLFPLALALVIAGTAPAAAQGEPTALQKVLGAMGLLEMPKDPIVYRERAPLVVPPAPGLVPPRSHDEIRAANPDWPVDHDNRRRSASDIEAEKAADELFYSGDRVGAIGLQRNRLTREQAARRSQQVPGVDPAENDRIGPDGLGFKGWGNKKEERVVFTGEPDRRSLTEPPPGLRTPSMEAPYGVVTTSPEPQRVRSDRSALPEDTGGRR